jgi:hypothetical protein
MYCPHCANAIPNGHPFCSKCGKPAGASSVASGSGAAVAPAKKKSSAGLRLIWLLLVIVVGLFAFRMVQSNNTGVPSTTIFKSPHSVSLVSSPVVVEPVHRMSYRFNVTSDMQNVTLVGHFTAQGGFGNDIRVVVVSEDDFLNWQNGHASRSYYDSKKTTAGNFSVRLPSSSTGYRLVFDNSFSLVSNKTVDVEAKLQFEQ